MAKSRVRGLRYCDAIKEFICSKIMEGETIVEICNNYPDQVPTRACLYKWRERYPEFKEALDDAHKVNMYRLLDELQQAMNYRLPKIEDIEAELGYELPDQRTKALYINAEMKRRKDKVDALKFVIAKIAPRFATELNETVKLEHSGKGSIEIVLPDWVRGGDKGGKK